MGWARKVFSQGKYGLKGLNKYERILRILSPSKVALEDRKRTLEKLRADCDFVLELAYALRYHLEGLDREESGLSETKMEAADLYQEIPERMGYGGVYSSKFYKHWTEIASYDGLDVVKLRVKFGRTNPIWFVEGEEEYFNRTPGDDHLKRPFGYVQIGQIQWFYIRAVHREMEVRRGEIRPL